MTEAHLHLLLNHFPIVGFLVVVIAFFWSLLKKNDSLLMFSLCGMVLLAMITYPVTKTGHAAEEVVESRTNFDEAYIHEHEEAAEYATPLMYITGTLAFIAIVFSRIKNNIPTWLKVIIVIAVLMTQTAMIRTGYLGGKIRRPELQKVMIENAEEEEDE